MTDITRKRGDTYAIEFVVKNDDVVVDITDCTFLLTVDPAKTPTDATNNLFQLTGVIIDAPAGTVAFTPTAEQVDHIGKFFYDIQMTNAAGAIRTITKAKFVLEQDITKT